MSLVRPDGEEFQKYVPWGGVRPSDEEYAKRACRCDDSSIACGYCMFVQSGARAKLAPEPVPPSQAHSETSRAAARSVAPRSSTLRQQVYDLLKREQLFTGGLTDEEIAWRLSINPSTARPRRIELVRAGRVMDSGELRKTNSGRDAVVWVAV